MRRLAVSLLCLVGCGFDPKVLDPNAVVPEVRFAFPSSITDETVGNATVFVELSEPTTNEVTVGIAVIEGGSATAGSDYDLQLSEITFAPGLRSLEVPIAIVSDSLAESDENILLELRAPFGATLGTMTTHDLKISANILPKISFATGTQALAEAVNSQQFPVQLDNPSTSDVLFAYSVTGSATLGSDHQLASGTLTLLAGMMAMPINATILDDGTDEEDETIDVALTALSGAVVGQNRTRQHKILDDDNPPILGFTAAAGTTAETGTATITVTLAIASAKTVSASYSVAAGSASAADFTTTSGTLTFTPGETSKSFTIAITDDALFEGNETLTLSLTNLVNATAGQLTQELTITDDDTAPTVEFETTSSTEDEDNENDRTLRIRLNKVSGLDVTFTVNTSGSATPGDDFTSPGGTFTISAGQQTTDAFVVQIRRSAPLNEPEETAIFTLATPSNATLGNQATHTITITE
jgi:hypothetical protein